MLRVGVFGVGHLGKIHIQQWKEIPEIELVGFYDPADENAATTEEKYQVDRFTDMESLLSAVDIVDIVSTTSTHHELAKICLLNGKHIFIEKPLAHTLEEGQELMQLVKEANVKCQIGHVERFNPAFTALADQKLQPLFIEAHRLAQFNPRGTDVAVILDLMIHDIDIVLHLVKSNVRRISASGVSVISENIDIANARIEFDNGCVANLTSSRISLKKMRKMRLFQRDAYIGIDFLNKTTEVIKMKPAEDTQLGKMDFKIDTPGGEERIISVQMPEVGTANAIRTELSEFIKAIINDKPVRVSVEDGYQAMDVAHQIIRKMNLHHQLYKE